MKKIFFISCIFLLIFSGGFLYAQNNPVISSLSPDGTRQFQYAAVLSFVVKSPANIAIPNTNISVQLTATSLLGVIQVQNLTGTNGLTITGAATNHTVTVPLASNLVYTVVIRVTDASGNSAYKTNSFDTIIPAYTFEAEDFDYNKGNFFENPQTNKYAGLGAVDRIDAHNSSGGDANYRPNPSGLATENANDKPRAAYGSGLTDFDVGWNDGGSGNWGNYTRTFPTNTYNIYMRAANFNGATTDSASLGIITSGRSTSNQIVSNLGTFSVPYTGDWQAYTWVPLLSTNGGLAKFESSGLKTLRVSTDNGNYNANFYMLMPADLSLPIIANLYPDGSNFFQYTNTFTFNVSNSSGILTNNITVNLDGVSVTGLVISGGSTSWNVNFPVLVNTNHTVSISVTANNGNTASTTVKFNDFQTNIYQLEAEDYDYGSGRFFDSQVDAYVGLNSTAGVDNHQFDLNGNSFLYRPNSPAPSTTLSTDQPRAQFTGHSDYGIGFFGGGSWMNYTRHYPAGTYYVWGRFAEGQTNTEAVLSQLIGGYRTINQMTNIIGTFNIPYSGGWSNWAWTPLIDDTGNPVKVRFDDSQITLQLAGSLVGGQPEVNVNFMILVPTTPDPFAVVRALNFGTNAVQIVYSKPLDPLTATNLANYFFTDGLPILSATLAADKVTVTLTTAPLAFGSNYSIVINNVQDRMNIPETIATNTIITLQALPYNLQDIGNPAVYSTGVVAGNGINLTAAGSDFGGASDQGNLSYQIYSGNFDVSVRLAGLGLSDVFAKAGLMARESLAPDARFAAVVATPAMNGTFFEWRDPAGHTNNSAGNFPANYPNTWLRLQRAGNLFTAYAGYDGQDWSQLGSVSIAMSNQLCLGPFVSSRSTNVVTTAQFRDFINVTNGTLTTIINPHDAMGPSSRKTPIGFSEIMYKPAPRLDGKNLEYIELYNSNPWFHDISGYQVTCADMNYIFPAGTIIPGGGYLVIAAAPVDVTSCYGITNVMGPYGGSLKKAESLELMDEHGAILLTVPYSNVYPWPIATDGEGHSLVLADPTYGEGDPRAWDISDVIGGSPGQMETFRPGPLRTVVINELLAHSENVAVPQFIELYNHSTNNVDISGCILTDDLLTNKFVIPTGTVIGPAGFVSFTQSQLGFELDGAGGTVYLIQPDQQRFLDAIQFGGQADGIPFGRWPDGANDFYALASRTPGTNNGDISIGDIVINELMYDPISGNDDDQYIELYNQGAKTMSLAGWQFNTAITFTFPSGAVIAPGGYLVVSRNVTNLLAKYPNLNSGNTIGNYSGKLSHNGELLSLVMPQTLNGNTIYVVADQVNYGTGGRWGEWSSGGGSSLELIDPKANHRLAANWNDSDDTSKSVWSNIEYTGVLDNGQNFGASIAYAQIGLLDAGECLVDNIEVDYNGSNFVANSTFENGTNGWAFQGCMTRSSLESTGYLSDHSLHIRSSDHVWPGDNSCQVSLNNTSLLAGQTATLRFKARWLHGWPEALLRLNGNWLEAAGALPVPSNLGSPGLPNSKVVTHAAPAIYNVTHFPSVPAANQPVVVSAQVHDSSGLKNLTLYYRLDPSASYVTAIMKDDGTSGDAVAGDGVFSATIPGQNVNRLVAFYLAATNNLNIGTRFPAILADNSPTRECVVMFGDGSPGGSFGVYHLWVTQASAGRWDALSDLSNEGNDCTFVNGNRVIYNMQARYAGSAYHQNFDTPYGAPCHYKWTFNDDDKFLGATSFNKIHQPGNYAGDDPSIQREQLANTFLRTLGVPWLNRRYAAVYVNGNRRGALMEDTQCPDADMVKEYFPDDPDGYLYKMQPWFEFAPFPSGESIDFTSVSGATLSSYTTTGGTKKIPRYRYNYLVRRTPDSASNFTNVFSLVDAASSIGSPNYVANMENVADMENWMRVFAANHASGNWDSFGGLSGQNLYGYIGALGTKYSLMMFDFNIIFSNSLAWSPGQNLFQVNGADPNLATIFATPTFVRMYWRAFQELIDGPLTVSKSAPLLDAKYKIFTANNLSVEDPALIIEPWLTQAKNSIASQLAAVNAANFTANPPVISNNVAYFNGTAPVAVDSVSFNGTAWPITWMTVTNWTVAVPLHPGNNLFAVVALDKNGRPIAGATTNAFVSYNGSTLSPAGQVVINEVMYNPLAPDTQFIELFNNSATNTFDLSGWQLSALSYTFPQGSGISPGAYLVLAANRITFANAYGATNPVFDVFSGTLQPGQILSLVQPGSNGASNVIVTALQSDVVLPWPTNAAFGSSLQLIDSYQDNWRVGNWAVNTNTGPVATPARANNVAATLAPFPTLWINEVEPEDLTDITNSAGQHVAWLELYNPGSNAVSLNGLYLANNFTNLAQWQFPATATIAAGQFKIIFVDGQTNLSTTNELHASFTLPASSGSLALTRMAGSQLQVLDYLDYNNLLPNFSYGSYPDGQSFLCQAFSNPTPGRANDGSSLPPPSFIAYLQPGSVYSQNFDGLPNPGATSVNSDNPVTINGITYSLSNPFDFAFPASANKGGLGIASMAGWYGLADPGASVGARFGATDGDQTTGGQISFGLPNDAHRALGLLATKTTGYTVFGAKFINGTGQTLKYINLSFTGEVWRQSDTAKTLQFYYLVDPIGTNALSTAMTATLPGLNVNFPTVAADKNGVAVDGTAAANQIHLAVTNQVITNWPPDAALWLVWEMASPAGNAQGLAIDDLDFSALVQPSNASPSLTFQTILGNQLVLSWPTLMGPAYQIEYATNLSSLTWTPIGGSYSGTGGTFSLTNTIQTSGQMYFRLKVTR